jgi:hypothetical protein
MLLAMINYFLQGRGLIQFLNLYQVIHFTYHAQDLGSGFNLNNTVELAQSESFHGLLLAL